MVHPRYRYLLPRFKRAVSAMSRIKYLTSCVMNSLMPKWLAECADGDTDDDRRADIEEVLLGGDDAWRVILYSIVGLQVTDGHQYQWAGDAVREESVRYMNLCGGTWLEDGDGPAVPPRTYSFTAREIKRDLKNSIMCEPGRTSRFLKWIQAEAAILAEQGDPACQHGFRWAPLGKGEARALLKALHTEVVPSFKDVNGALIQAGTPRHILLVALLAHIRASAPATTGMEDGAYTYDHFTLLQFWGRARERILSVGGDDDGWVDGAVGDEVAIPEDDAWDPLDHAYEDGDDDDGVQQHVQQQAQLQGQQKGQLQAQQPPPPQRRIRCFTLFPMYRPHEVSPPA